MIHTVKNNKGFALAFSLLFLTLVIAFLDIYFQVASGGLRTSRIIADSKRAYYAADAGLADAFMKLRGDANPTSFTIPLSGTTPPQNYTIGSKTATYSVVAVHSGGSWPTVTMTSTGSYGNISKTLELIVKQTSASRFAYLSNSETHPTYGKLWWITGMTMLGPVHTNGQFNIWGDPIFDGPVSQVNASVNYYHGGPPQDDPDFTQGLTTGAGVQGIFNNTILTNISTAAAASGGLLLTGNSTISFQANGTINVTNAAKGWVNHNTAMPTNKSIYVQSGSATVNGVVNGQVSVGSSNSIFINNHLTYKIDPRITPTSTDLISLVASQNITVTTAAPNNLAISAVMVAINGSFQVDQFWLGIRGNMVQYGSLINNVSGPTGVFDPATGILSGGYNQLQFYDERLKTLIPPWFPPSVDANGRAEYIKVSLKEL